MPLSLSRRNRWTSSLTSRAFSICGAWPHFGMTTWRQRSIRSAARIEPGTSAITWSRGPPDRQALVRDALQEVGDRARRRSRGASAARPSSPSNTQLSQARRGQRGDGPARDRRQPRHRVDLERGADAQHQVGLEAERLRLASAASGSISPNSTTSGFSGATHAWHSGAPSPRRAAHHPLERHLAAALEAHALLDRPVHLDQPLACPRARCSRSMFWVITAADEPAPLQLGERRVGAVRLLVHERGEALRRRSCQKRSGSRRQASMWATSIGSTFSHSPVPGRAEVRDPRGHRDPGAGEDDGALGVAQQRRPSRSAARGGRVATLTRP